MTLPRTNVATFESDEATRGGYGCTATNRFGCRLATGQFAGRSVVVARGKSDK